MVEKHEKDHLMIGGEAWLGWEKLCESVLANQPRFAHVFTHVKPLLGGSSRLVRLYPQLYGGFL